MNTKILLALMLSSSLLLASCSDGAQRDDQEEQVSTTVEVTDTQETESSEEGVMVGGAMMVESKDIVDNAMESADHTTLVAALGAAGLVETLKSEGPFTVFAPTNMAFSELPEGTVETLLMEENKADLTAVLTYHVVSGTYTSQDITEGLELTTVQGENLVFTYENGSWMVNGAKIEIADAKSSNGVTHIIDAVLLPGTNTDDEVVEDDMDDTQEEDNNNDED